MIKISAVLIARNEEKKIEKCLEGIKWCDEIIFIDQSSQDKTVDIAKRYTDKIFVTNPKGICNPDRNFGISKAENDWILIIEADEVVCEDLRREISEVLSQNKADIFYLPVKTFFSGRWIKTCGWYPGYIPRLFRKGSVIFEEDIHTNGIFKTDKIGYLKNDLLHYSYDDINEWMEKFKRYTDRYALEYYKKGLKPSLILSVKEILVRPLYFFLLKYFWLKGFKDGWRGFFISLSSALTVMFSYFKFLEIYEKNNL
ncbi:MAG: glycosyltransferase family 2 protein [Elusimicrobiales bacterium]|jgi:glycosyltransferase involved in cell wall biosynthesis